VAAVAGAFATARGSPERALGLYLAAFVCDELVRRAEPPVWLLGARGVAKMSS